ncbi:MAG: hypothetical protein U1C57_01930 [Candidatus Doudnabacteria bacterium]|nr:hypothetical protein [Desulfobacterales bacterium]MDZ4243843.1 hypothetical protein [Candidatus Doudnabacteria bacterium]
MEDGKILQDFDHIFRTTPDVSERIREVTWFRNILFFLGEQWVSWLTDANTFGARGRANPNDPVTVANNIRDYVRSMKALILNKQYIPRIWPNSEEQKDKDAADLGAKVLKWLASLQCNALEDVKENIALWMILTGNGFGRTYAGKDTGNYILDAKGNSIIRGDVVDESIIPFNVHVPTLGDTLRKKAYVGIKGLKETEWIEDIFKVILKTGNENAFPSAIESQLMTLVANVSPWKGRSLEGGGGLTNLDNTKLTLFKEVEYRPTLKYPKGRYIAVAGGQVLINKEEMPIKVTEDGDWEYTVTEFKYNHTPGSFWATSGIDDLISPQITINEVDQALMTNRKDLGRPFVLTPMDLILRRKSNEGQNFLSMEWDPLLSNGQKPEVVRGTPYPEQILKEREINTETIQNAAGDPKNILRGKTPTKQASGVLVDILRESAELGHTPDIERFYRSWNRMNKKQLMVAQELFTETRLLKIAGEGSEIIIRGFKGSDLRNNTDVRLEKDSGVSTTRAGQNQFIMDLVSNNFFGVISEQPKVQYELMRRFGMSWIPVETSVHEERAGMENSVIGEATQNNIIANKDNNGQIVAISLPGIFTVAGTPQTGEEEVTGNDPYFKYDDHKVHYDSHTNVILSCGFKAWPPENQMILINHTDVHHFQVVQAQQAAMQQQMMLEGKVSQHPAGGQSNEVPAG